jgi:hypothetical protein
MFLTGSATVFDGSLVSGYVTVYTVYPLHIIRWVDGVLYAASYCLFEFELYLLWMVVILLSVPFLCLILVIKIVQIGS